jgi:hypothetical protein
MDNYIPMKKLLLALALCLLPTLASAQCAGVFQPNQVCGNNTASPRPPFPISGLTSIYQVPTVTTTGQIVTFGTNIGTTLIDSAAIITSQTLTTSAIVAPTILTSTDTTSTVNATTLNIPKISTPTIYTSTLYTSTAYATTSYATSIYIANLTATTSINTSQYLLNGIFPTTTVNNTSCSLTQSCITSSAAVEFTPILPTSTTSTTGVMIGYGAICKITPSYASRLEVHVIGNLVNSADTDTAVTSLYFGSGSAPTSPSAITGTLVGKGVNSVAGGSPGSTPFTLGGYVTGLTSGTSYWFDLALASPIAGTASLNNINCFMKEF